MDPGHHHRLSERLAHRPQSHSLRQSVAVSNNHILPTLPHQRSPPRLGIAQNLAVRSLERQGTHVGVFLQKRRIPGGRVPERYEKFAESRRSGLFEFSRIELVLHGVDVYTRANVLDGVSILQLFGLLAIRRYVFSLFG